MKVKIPPLRPRGGGDSNITVTGMLIVSLWVVNCTLWVFGMECYCFCSFKCCLVLYIRKFTKNALTLTT